MNQLIKQYKLFDLHCDTIVILQQRNENFHSPTTQFSLNHRDKFEGICQTLAIFIPDHIRGKEAQRYFEVNFAYLQQLLSSQKEIAGFARNMQEMEQLVQQGKSAFLLSIESGSALGGDLDKIEEYAKCGVKMMTLTWNGDNELASGHGTDQGFTEFGRRAVKRMEENHMVVDVSHLNDRGFDELCDFAEKPFIATHSNLRTICSHKRNLTEEQFREIVNRRGLVGINLHEAFISDDQCGTGENIFRHVYRMLELGGEDIIASGSDFDGADIHESLNTVEKYAGISEYFITMGISKKVVNKIFFENAVNFFKRQEADK